MEPLLRELIGGSLRRSRLSQGRTLADVAASAGVSMQHLSEVERGRKDPSSEVLAAIIGALGLRLPEVLAMCSDPSGVQGRVAILDLTVRRPDQAERQHEVRPGPGGALNVQLRAAA